MNKILLRLALPALLTILEATLQNILKQEVKIPDSQRQTLQKLGYSDEKLDAIDARVSAQVADRVMREVARAVNKAVK